MNEPLITAEGIGKWYWSSASRWSRPVAEDGEPASSDSTAEGEFGSTVWSKGGSQRASGLARTLWPRRHRFDALADVQIIIEAGASIGLVGESGSGKTTLGRIIAGLLSADCGSLCWRGQAIAGLAPDARRRFRREVQYVFQNPVAALNPRHRVGWILEWTLRGLTRLGPAERTERIRALSRQVGIDPALLGRFPHQLSGGQAQRVAIARALLGEPRLVILDEPVSALDVSHQAQLLNLLAELRTSHRLAYLFISHDLAVVERLCEQIVVMRAGRIIEHGPRERILAAPGQDYTRRLLAAVPRLAAGATSPTSLQHRDTPCPWS